MAELPLSETIIPLFNVKVKYFFIFFLTSFCFFLDKRPFFVYNVFYLVFTYHNQIFYVLDRDFPSRSFLLSFHEFYCFGFAPLEHSFRAFASAHLYLLVVPAELSGQIELRRCVIYHFFSFFGLCFQEPR